MRSTIASLAVLLLSNCLFADAQAVITGPDKVRPGQLFVLETTGSIGDAQQWIMPSVDIQSLECGTKIGMAIERSGVYVFHLVVADKVPTIDVATHTVTVGGSTNPPIDPPPPPPPTPPGDFSQLVAKSKQAAQSLNDRATANGLSVGLKSIASQSFGDLTSARKAVSATIESVLLQRQGASRDRDWLNIWRRPIAIEIETLSAAGAFPTPAAYLAAIRALAQSLE